MVLPRTVLDFVEKTAFRFSRWTIYGEQHDGLRARGTPHGAVF